MWHSHETILRPGSWVLFLSPVSVTVPPQTHDPVYNYFPRYTDMESEDYHFYQGLVYLLENDVSTLGYDLTFSTEVGQETHLGITLELALDNLSQF